MLRPFTVDESVRFGAAMLLAQEQAPYLTSALLSLRPVADDTLGTFAVDATWRLYIDPAQFDVWTPAEQAAVLLHEVGHVLRDHHGRAQAHGATDPSLWNAVGDAAINHDLLECGVVLPGGITPQALGVPEGLTAEQMYDLLADSNTPPPGGGDGGGQGDEPWDGGCGSGSGGMAAPCEPTDATGSEGDGDVGGDAPTPMTDAEAELLRRKVAEDVRRHTDGSTARGTVPAGWRRWAESVLAPSPIPWQQVLAAAISRNATLVRGRVDTSYRRRSTRRYPRVVLPGNVRPQPSLGTVIDTSGSMSDDQVQVALEQVQAIIRRCGLRGRDHTVLTVDAATYGAPKPVTDARQITVTGGGGTDMRVGIDALAAQRNAPSMCLVLTDGHTPWPQTRPPKGMRLIIGIIGDGDLDAVASRCPSWATVVRIPVDRDGADLPAGAAVATA